jgi:hypothetical protein
VERNMPFHPPLFLLRINVHASTGNDLQCPLPVNTASSLLLVAVIDVLV